MRALILLAALSGLVPRLAHAAPDAQVVAVDAKIVVTGRATIVDAGAARATDAAAAATTKPAVTPKLPAPDDIKGILSQLVSAVRLGSWGLAIALLSMLLTWLLRNVLQGKLPTKSLPWISSGLGALQATGLSLAAGISVFPAVLGGIGAGLGGSGLFDAIGQYILKNWGKTNETEAAKK